MATDSWKTAITTVGGSITNIATWTTYMKGTAQRMVAGSLIDGLVFFAVCAGLFAIVFVSSFSGCMSRSSLELRDKLETVDDCHEITYIFADKLSGDWVEHRIKLFDNCTGEMDTVFCRFNRETKDIVWPYGKPDYIWVID